jgi:hypothetical protein
MPHAEDARPYYEKLNRAVDYLVRCQSRHGGCGALVPTERLHETGMCPRCGNRGMAEIRSLRPLEYLRIYFGLLDFPYRAQFLAEFSFFGRRRRAR